MGAEVNNEEMRFGDVKRAAEIIGVSTVYLNKLRIYRPDDSPPFFHIGRRVVYPLNGPRGLTSWVEQRLQGGLA